MSATISFQRIVASSVGVIREYSTDSSIVAVKVVNVIARVAQRIRRNNDLDALWEQLGAIATNAYVELSPHDLSVVRLSEQDAQQQLQLAFERISKN